MLGISQLTSFILALTVVLAAKLVISSILSTLFLNSALYTSFLTTFFITLLTNFPMSDLYTSLSKLLKTSGIVFNLEISNLSTLGFKLAKSVFFREKMMYQHLLHFLNLFLLHN